VASVVTMNTATKYERFVIFIVTFLNIVDENSLYSLMQRSISLNFRRLTENQMTATRHNCGVLLVASALC